MTEGEMKGSVDGGTEPFVGRKELLLAVVGKLCVKCLWRGRSGVWFGHVEFEPLAGT